MKEGEREREKERESENWITKSPKEKTEKKKSHTRELKLDERGT